MQYYGYLIPKDAELLYVIDILYGTGLFFLARSANRKYRYTVALQKEVVAAQECSGSQEIHATAILDGD